MGIRRVFTVEMVIPWPRDPDGFAYYSYLFVGVESPGQLAVQLGRMLWAQHMKEES